MTMMHYDNYDGEYGCDLISIKLYHPFPWGSRVPCSILSQLYDEYDNDNDVDLLYDDDDDVNVNNDYACGRNFGS